MNLSKVTIIGNVGRDPELKMTPNGRPVCEFSVAVNSKEGSEEHTDWFRVSVWGTLAERAQQFVQKGRLVYVEGRLRVRTYTDREGASKVSIDVNASDFRLLDKRDREADPVAAGTQATRPFDPYEIPF